MVVAALGVTVEGEPVALQTVADAVSRMVTTEASLIGEPR